MTDDTRLGYVPALDGLRGVAVLLVMLHHTKILGFVGGGLVGVETFFVLSGFLITSLLLDEQRTVGRIALGTFYLRRALRLLPALLAVVAVVAAYAAFTGESHTLGATPGVLLYAANWIQVTGRPLGMFTHTWSLALEEQFYLVWPFVLALLFRRHVTRATLLALTMGAAIASTALRVGIWLDGHDVVRVRDGFDTRVAGLLLGAACAMVMATIPRGGPRSWARVAPFTATVGAMVLLGFSFTPINVAGWGYAWGVTAVQLGALAVIVAAVLTPRTRLGRVLAFRRLRAVGAISYGLYLWHFPVFLVVRHRFHLGQPLTVVIQFAVSFALAWLSAQFVERPALRRKARLAVRPAAAGLDRT